MKSESEYELCNTISKKHAAAILRVSLSKIEKMVKSGQIKCISVKGSRYGRIVIKGVVSLLLQELDQNQKRNAYIKYALQELQQLAESNIPKTVDYQDGQKVLDKWNFSKK